LPEKEWPGGEETNSLKNKAATAALTLTSEVLKELQEFFKVNYPKALERVKVLLKGRMIGSR